MLKIIIKISITLVLWKISSDLQIHGKTAINLDFKPNSLTIWYSIVLL